MFLCRRSVLLAICLTLVSAAAAQPKRFITEKDLFDFTWIGDPQMSPDGKRVAFVRVTVNDKKDDYDTSIWTVSTDTGELQRLTSGSRDEAPRWSPDGKRLAFVRSVEQEGKRQPGQIFVLPLSGGEAFQVTKLPKGAQSPVWSPDDTRLAFTSRTNAEDLKREECKGKKEAERIKDPKCAPLEHESDVRVITRAVYRMNGPGYLDPKHSSHIWTVEVTDKPGEMPKPKQLTLGYFDENDPTWSKDGKRIFFTSNRNPEPYYELPTSELYAVAADGGDIQRVAAIQGTIGDLALSPDGNWLAFEGVINRPARSYNQPDMFVVELKQGSQPRNLSANFDYDVGAGLTGDQRAPRGGAGSKPLWTQDGKSILDVVAREGRANLERLDVASGNVTPFSIGNHEVIAFTATPDRSQVALLISTPTSIGDLFLVNPSGGPLKRLTNINEKLFSQLRLTEPEEITYASFDGKKIQAWVQKPPDFDPGKKYPLILNIHGGPHAAYGYTFDHEFQWMAAKGYVVLYPNPRGSTSYGQEFGNVIQYRYPGDDYKDLMAGVDDLIKRGYVDPKKLGVTGGSGGGLLTNWTIGQTDRFAAAVSQRDIADWADWWYTADFTLFQPTWFRKAPFEDPAEYAARSPITHITRVTTPLMLILGETDWRTPTGAGGEQMFRALKYRKVPTAMIRFPNESHELSRSGQPWHRVERLQHIVNWFDIYLQGKKIAGYEVTPPEAKE